MKFYEDYEPGVSWEIGRHTVSRQEIVEFAQRWDPQPFHVDEAAAAASVFGGLTASSVHTYAVSSLIASTSPRKPVAVAMLGMEVKFPNPVRPGDEIVMHSECLEKRVSRKRPELGVVTTRGRLLRNDRDLVMQMDATFLVARRAGDAVV